MFLKNDSKAVLTKANSSFRRGEYKEALALYNHLVERYPRFEHILAPNIDLSKRRLANSYVNPNSAIASANAAPESNLELLDRPITVNTKYRPLPDQQCILRLLEAIGQSEALDQMLADALLCSQHSPFQRALLSYTGTLARDSGIDTRASARIIDGIPTMAFMACLAFNHQFWLTNRVRYKTCVQNLELEDPRAWDLADLPPAPGINESSHRSKHAESVLSRPTWESRFPISQALPKRDMTVHAGTILLNEQDYIGINLLQHYGSVDTWTLVEGACKGYPARKVTAEGLSADYSAAQIKLFPDPENKLRFVQHGWTCADGEDAKCELRNRYLDVPDADLLLVIDADEFYLDEHIAAAKNEFNNPRCNALTLPQAHFWKSYKKIITGGYYDVSHTRFFRNTPGMKYISNHNFPELAGALVTDTGRKKIKRKIVEVSGKNGYQYTGPLCYHFGFAKTEDDMQDKTDYYINRGETTTRPETTACRTAWFTDDLPGECNVWDWAGQLPAAIELKEANRQ